jgi:hypothetical protein
VIEVIPAGNDVNLLGLATTETVTQHVNLNYFSEAVSWEGEARLADADSWRITGYLLSWKIPSPLLFRGAHEDAPAGDPDAGRDLRHYTEEWLAAQHQSIAGAHHTRTTVEAVKRMAHDSHASRHQSSTAPPDS